ncbi:hypothetical protein LCGC14_0362120 [marine sediment metagenome]|uniref:Uncharacterized protein n=1 Tax=marine sediment metagenome TaxID=412755 RepID=A0A0F9TDJ3_9ZZZZ
MSDKRELGERPSFPVASTAFAQLSFPNGATGATLIDTATLNINGVIEQIEIEISTFTDGAKTMTINIASAQNANLFNEGSLADATTHLKQALSFKNSADADFNPALVDGALTLTGTISGDPGASGGTVDVTIFYR